MFYYKDENGEFYKSNIKLRLLTPITREEFLSSQILNKDIPEYQEHINAYKTKELYFYKENENYFALDEKWRYDGYTQIAEEEYLAEVEKQKQITEKQARLEVVKWKIEQVDLFHEERADIDNLRAEARQLHHELEELKK